jgi:hypothetical protein
MNTNFCVKCVVLGVCACVIVKGASIADHLSPLGGERSFVTISSEGSKGPPGGDAPELPAQAIDALAQASGSAGPTGAATPFLNVNDEITGEVRSGVWPHGKPERALGPTGSAGDSVVSFVPTGATCPTGAVG